MAAITDELRTRLAMKHAHSTPTCEVCLRRPSVKTDGQSRSVCGKCALAHLQPGQFRYATKPQGRNDPCRCGSGNKAKRCCGSAATVNTTREVIIKRIVKRTYTGDPMATGDGQGG